MPSPGAPTVSDMHPLCKRKPQVLNAKLKPPITDRKCMSDKVSMLSLFFNPGVSTGTDGKSFPPFQMCLHGLYCRNSAFELKKHKLWNHYTRVPQTQLKSENGYAVLRALFCRKANFTSSFRNSSEWFLHFTFMDD